MIRASTVFGLVLVLMPRVALAGTGDIGDVSVIEDTQDTIVPHCDPDAPNGSICTPDSYCREAAKYFYQTHCDNYDALVVFLDYTWTGQAGAIVDVEQGTPVQQHINGINRDQHYDFTSTYGSAGRLEQCVSMTTLGTKPDNPDDPVTGVLGLPLPLGITGIELLGHEFGHHWLMGANFDLGAKGGNLGVETLLRQCDTGSGGTTGPCDPNLHYAYYVNSHSVMYGNFLTDNGDTTYTLCGGTPRGYNELDQYMMGLRSASQMTNPNDVIWALDDGTHTGDPASASPPGTCSTTQPGAYTRVNIGIADLVRAMGPWSGPAAEVPIGWNVGFILVEPAGQTPSQAALAKVNAYRSEFQTWFTTATSNLGSINTSLVPNNCNLPPPPTDGGTPDAGVVDAGTPDAGPPDAGVVDAGPPDAGVADAGPPDAGVVDAGPLPQTDGGRGCGVIPCDDGGAAPAPDGGSYGTLHAGGCDCDATGTSGIVLPALVLMLLLGLRRRRTSQSRSQ